MVKAGFVIVARCIPCGNEATIDPAPLVARFGARTPAIYDSPLYGRLVCSKCGQRSMSLDSRAKREGEDRKPER